MQVYDAEKQGWELLLQMNPLLQGAHQISQVWSACRLDPRENPFHHFLQKKKKKVEMFLYTQHLSGPVCGQISSFTPCRSQSPPWLRQKTQPDPFWRAPATGLQHQSLSLFKRQGLRIPTHFANQVCSLVTEMSTCKSIKKWAAQPESGQM